ncbi:acyl-CoA thioesterase [Hydrogenimonas sp.]
MKSSIYTYDFIVKKDVIDLNGHVGNVTYLQWMIEAATSHSNAAGWGFEACKDIGGAWVAKSHHIEYLHPAFENDTLQMETWLEEIGKIKALRRYRLRRKGDGLILCKGETEWVFVNAESMRPMRIPASIAEAFRKAEEVRSR